MLGKYHNRHAVHNNYDMKNGQVALMAIIFFLLISLTVLGGFTMLALRQLAGANELLTGKKAFANVESGVEDMVLRVLRQWNYNKTMTPPTTTVSLNGGNTIITLERDGYTADAGFPKRFEVAAQGVVSFRYRNAGFRFEIPDEKLAVSVKSAIHAGYLGVDINGASEIHGTSGYKKGDVFSNGSLVRSVGGSPLIDGDVRIAEGIGGVIQQQHNGSFSAPVRKTSDSGAALGVARSLVCTGECYAINKSNGQTQTNEKDAAQAFISNASANLLRIRVLMSNHGQPAEGLFIRILGNVKSGATDIPDTSGDDLASLQVSNTTLNAMLPTNDSFYWAEFDIPTITGANLVMDKKYWIVFDGQCANSTQSSGCTLAKYYELAALDSNYIYGNDKDGLPNTSWDSSYGGPAVFFNFHDYSIQSDRIARSNDIAFQIYMGEDQTKIDGKTMPDKRDVAQRGGSYTVSNLPEIIGSAYAEYMRAVNIGGTAYYKNLAGAYPIGEVKAGGEYNIVSNNPVYHGDPAKNRYQAAYQPWIDESDGPRWHDLGTDQFLCQDVVQNTPAPNYSRQTPFTYSTSGELCNQPRYTVDARQHCWDFYCSCNWAYNGGGFSSSAFNTVVQNGAFCKVVAPEDLPDPQNPEGLFPEPKEPFGINGKVLNAVKLKELKAKAQSLGIYEPCVAVPTNCSGGWFLLTSGGSVPAITSIPGITSSFASDSPGPYFIKPTNRTAILGGYIVGNVRMDTAAGINLTGRVPSWMVSGNSANPVVAASTTLASPVDMTDRCPYNMKHATTEEERRKPCYVLWITGDLEIIGTDNEISGLPPTGVEAKDADFSLYVVVEGSIKILQSPRFYAFPYPTGESQFFMISNSGKSSSNDPAIKLQGSAKGATFFAMRGAFAATQNVGIKVKAIVAQFIYLEGGAKIYFDEGLRSPFSDSGGHQVTGANISAYYEKR